MSHGRNDPSASFSLSGKQDYKKTKPALRATRLKAEAKRSAPGIRKSC
uniref:Triple QxxK/R motif-containing protein n=1 Tax=Sinocyclocheilus grahami TaxID=75366 RepID=A0A672K8R9_SINGR